MNAALENAFSALTREGGFIIYYLSCLIPWRLKLTIQICYRVSVFLELKPWFHTLPTAEILKGKNARAFLVCGLLMKSFKKEIS